MAEQQDDELLKKLVEAEPQVISTSASDITVSARDKDDVEHELVYPDTTASGVIATSSFANLGTSLTPDYQQRFIEQIDVVKSKPYIQEVDFEVEGPKLTDWPPSLGSLKLKIKRSPKIIKVYKSKET